MRIDDVNVDAERAEPVPQTETIAAMHADVANELTTFWAQLVAQHGIHHEDVTCALHRQRSLTRSLDQYAADVQLAVTITRRGSAAQSSRRQASTLFRIDTGIV